GEVGVEIWLFDTTSGKLLAHARSNGTEQDLFRLMGGPSDRVREELGVATVASSDLTDIFASVPADPMAARFYSEGIARLSVFDTMAAIPLFQKALAVAPSYSLIHADLAEAWSELGHDSEARLEAQRAFELS